MILAITCSGCAMSLGLRDHDQAESENVMLATRAGILGASAAADLHDDPRVRWAKEYRKAHPTCVVCGAKSNITNGNRNDVHHLIPIHTGLERGQAWLAWTPGNLATLCRNCHHRYGHLGNWRDYNPYLVEEAAQMRSVHVYWLKEIYDVRRSD